MSEICIAILSTGTALPFFTRAMSHVFECCNRSYTNRGPICGPRASFDNLRRYIYFLHLNNKEKRHVMDVLRHAVSVHVLSIRSPTLVEAVWK
jgi:hypothetical protein